MSFEITVSKGFQRELKFLAKKYHSLKSEYAQLIESLKEKPDLGTPLGKNCYKIRLAIESKSSGKSGGARVITYVVTDDQKVILLSIYDKSEKSTISDKELEKLIESVQ